MRNLILPKPKAFKVWDPDKEQMSPSMPMAGVAGYIQATYPNLKNEMYLESVNINDDVKVPIHELDILGFNVYSNHELHRPGDRGIVFCHPEIGWITYWDSGQITYYEDGFKNNKITNVIIIGNALQNPDYLTQKLQEAIHDTLKVSQRKAHNTFHTQV